MAFMQDSAHARKTYRNNLESGAKTIVLGNFTTQYKDLREMAFDAKSPLYHRDVEKTDKQDDRAAAWVFSSAAFVWLCKNRPDNLGIIMYLFIFGELVDAYQNRSITHYGRLHMVLRAHYFVEIWKRFLKDAAYPFQMACISREALDITSFLVHGYLELLFIYRDYLSDVRVPLLPWLHSSEACEHIFAECRKEIKDFDFADFLHLIPKIHFLVRYSMRLGTEDAKAWAGGYAHTWTNLDGLSLSNLASFPTDKQIQQAAVDAFQDAEEIWQQLGVYLADLSPLPESHNNIDELTDEKKDDDNGDSNANDDDDRKPKSLLTISAWFASPKDALHAAQDFTSNKNTSRSLGIEESERAVLERLFTYEQYASKTGPIRLDAINKAMVNVSCAKLLLDFDSTLRIDDIKLPSDEQFHSFLDEYQRSVGKTLADSLPQVVDLGAGLHPAPQLRLTLETLGALRREHETALARKAIWTEVGSSSDMSRAEINDSRARCSLIKKISETLKLRQDIGTGTGLERRARWTMKDLVGNAANAAATAASRASKALAKRTSAYSALQLPKPFTHRFSSAEISESTPLQNGTFGIVYFSGRLYIAQVLSVYSKGSGKHGKHAWVEHICNIGQVSYISLQLFEQAGGRVFREVHSSVAQLHICTFAHIRSYEFICGLPDQPFIRHNQNSIQLSDASFAYFLQVQQYSHLLQQVMGDLKTGYDDR